MLLLMPVFSLLGLFTGSFLNVCIDRLPAGESIIRPPSHCSACQRKLAVLDLIPVFSYLWLRGRCRYCQATIPRRIPIVEGITAVIFTLLYWQFGLGVELVISLVYASLLVVIFVIDLEHQLVLDKVSYPAMILVFGLSLFWPGSDGITLFGPGVLDRLLTSLSGGVFGLLLMALPFIIYRRGMGMGDIKLGALVGLMVGFPLVFVAVLLSWISGGVIGAVLLLLKIKQRTDPVPFAPFLATAAMITLLWGQEIWQWYLPGF